MATARRIFPEKTSTATRPRRCHRLGCFEAVFDYGEHDADTPSRRRPARHWNCRMTPYPLTGTFEVRTYRLCQRCLCFHHFPDEPGIGNNCLSTHRLHPILRRNACRSAPIPSIPYCSWSGQTGYQRQPGGYLSNSLPPLESITLNRRSMRRYGKSMLQVSRICPTGSTARTTSGWIWMGRSLGILTEQAGSWFTSAT